MKSRRDQPRSPYGVILATFAIALVLNILDYPEWMSHAEPDWVLLVLFYWCLATPDRIGVGAGWIVGILLDILYYALLGHHAVGKAFVALVAVSAHRRLRLYHLWQQCIVVFLVASVDIALVEWIYHLTQKAPIQVIYWQSALVTALIWPVIYNALRLLRHRTGIR